jgi:hypothetical protein
MWHDFSCNTTFPLLVGFDTATPGRLAPGGWNGIVTDTALQERTDTSWLSTSFFCSRNIGSRPLNWASFTACKTRNKFKISANKWTFIETYLSYYNCTSN